MPKVKVEVYGQSYSIVTPNNDQNYVKELAVYVDSRMREASGKTNAMVPNHKIAVLAALHIADELFTLRKELKSMKEKEAAFNQKAEEILKTLNQS